VKKRTAGIRLIIVLSLLWIPGRLLAADPSPASNQTVVLENFKEDSPGTFPTQWKVRGNEAVAKAVYRVAEENGPHFLHAYADKQDVQIGLTRTFQSKEFPVLQWRWRVQKLPPGGDESAKKTNDSAAAVYVVFDSSVIPRAIKYVWSSTLPVGTRITSPVYGRGKVVVLQSGPSQLNEWRQETVNVYEDYKNLFGREPGEAQGIAVLTDSDATKSVAEADYADFILFAAGASPNQAAEPTAAQLAPVVVSGQ
jgi:hypothetical protein